MKTVVGVFKTREEAIKAANLLQSLGFEGHEVIVLCPGTPDARVESAVPTEDAEQPGIGKAIGSVVGGAVGLSAGVLLGSLLLPGIGSVLALTFGAAAGGLGGAAVGAAAGGALENMLSMGLPKDEIFFYEDALRHGRSVVIGMSGDDEKIEAGRKALEKAGAESLDGARERWWIGLRDAEEVEYQEAENFKQIENTYRQGFIAALEPEARGRSFQDAAGYLKQNFPDCYSEDSFRRGFERGQHYYRNLPQTEEADR